MSVNTFLRRALLGILVVLAASVGAWAAVFPLSFYSSFPGLGLHWVSSDGPFNEHLIRDVGGLYLGFAAAAVGALVSRSATPARVVGAGWSLVGIVHIGYHLGRLAGSGINQVATVATLALSLMLGLVLLLPGRRSSDVASTTGKVAL